MSNLAISDIWRVRPLCYANGQLGQLDLAVKVLTLPIPGTDDDDLADAMDAVWGALLKGWMPATSDYVATAVERIFPIPLDAAVASAVSTGVGTATGSLLPTQVAGLVSIRTGLRGRSFRGRAYIPFPAAEWLSAAGLITAGGDAYLASIATEVNSVRTIPSGGVPGATVEYGVYSKKLSLFTASVGSLPATGWATQRRRGFFGRPNVPPV